MEKRAANRLLCPSIGMLTPSTQTSNPIWGIQTTAKIRMKAAANPIHAAQRASSPRQHGGGEGGGGDREHARDEDEPVPDALGCPNDVAAARCPRTAEE